MKVALLRPENHIENSIHLLTSAGFDVIAIPFIKIERDKEGIAELEKLFGEFDTVIVTSQTAARIVSEHPKILKDKRIIAIGKKTAAILFELGVKAELPSKFDSKTLFEEFADKLRGARVLILRSNKGDATLLKLSNFAEIKEIVLYKIEREWGEEQKKLVRLVVHGHIDAIVFSSSMMVKSFMELADAMGLLEDTVKALNNLHTIAIGPPTKKVLEEYGVKAIMPAEYTLEGVVALLDEINKS
jgi:uroporphyrinogen-III synthase